MPQYVVCVSVRYHDHVGWNTSKIISRLVSLRLCAWAEPNMGDLVQIRVEYGWGHISSKPAISPKRCKIGPRLLWWTDRKSHTRFRLVPKSMTLDDLERQKRTLAEKKSFYGAQKFECIYTCDTSGKIVVNDFSFYKYKVWANIRRGSLDMGRRMRVEFSKRRCSDLSFEISLL